MPEIKWRVTCLNCDYLARFESKELAHSAMKMHQDLKNPQVPKHTCVLESYVVKRQEEKNA